MFHWYCTRTKAHVKNWSKNLWESKIMSQQKWQQKSLHTHPESNEQPAYEYILFENIHIHIVLFFVLHTSDYMLNLFCYITIYLCISMFYPDLWNRGCLHNILYTISEQAPFKTAHCHSSVLLPPLRLPTKSRCVKVVRGKTWHGLGLHPEKHRKTNIATH